MPRLNSTSVFFSLDHSSGVPVFKQIMDQVKFLVASGQLKAGEPLPATRSLAAILGINPMTVSKAYRYLEKEEVVQYRPGKAVVVRQTLEGVVGREKVKQLRRHLAPCVVVTHQLGLDSREAVAVFQEMLRQEPRSPESTEPDDGWQNW